MSLTLLWICRERHSRSSERRSEDFSPCRHNCREALLIPAGSIVSPPPFVGGGLGRGGYLYPPPKGPRRGNVLVSAKKLRKVSKHEGQLLSMKRRGLCDGSFNGRESSLQQLAPYVGKLKTGIVNSLVQHFTKKGEWICDPFCGAGVVPFEALLLGRRAACSDLSRYAYCITRGKVEAPATKGEAITSADKLLRYVASTQPRPL